jgi:uncharacterized protein (TIGR02246 family)
MHRIALRRLLEFGITFAALAAGAGNDGAIQAALRTQVEAWNRGDIPAFVATYAEDCTFVGKQILHGRPALLARYQKTYPSADAMGRLAFSDLEVRLLDKQVAVVTGKWHLERAPTGGGPVGGVFSLVFALRNGRWLIVLDHTT